MSAATWMQVVLLNGFKWHNAVRALPKAVHRAYQTNPHSVPATMKCLYHITRHMPATRCVVVAQIGAWLKEHAIWDHSRYSSWRLPNDLVV